MAARASDRGGMVESQSVRAKTLRCSFVNAATAGQAGVGMHRRRFAAAGVRVGRQLQHRAREFSDSRTWRSARSARADRASVHQLLHPECADRDCTLAEQLGEVMEELPVSGAKPLECMTCCWLRLESHCAGCQPPMMLENQRIVRYRPVRHYRATPRTGAPAPDE